MRIVDDFRIFNKILRKYRKKHCIKRIDRFSNGKKYTSYWEKEDWLGYIVTSPDAIYSKGSIGEYFVDMVGPVLYSHSKKEIYQLYKEGNEVTLINTHNNDEVTGKFLGVILTNMDSFYLIEDGEYRNLVPVMFELKQVD